MKFDKEGILRIILIWLALLSMALMMDSCRTTYVPVETIHTEYINSIDTIEKVDSFWRDRTTVVREVDSAAMAQYGIQLQQQERAWLVQMNELERELSKEREHRTDTFIQRDSIPYRVEVEKPLNRWQRLSMRTGNVVLLLLLLAIVGGGIYLLLRLRFRR